MDLREERQREERKRETERGNGKRERRGRERSNAVMGWVSAHITEQVDRHGVCLYVHVSNFLGR